MVFYVQADYGDDPAKKLGNRKEMLHFNIPVARDGFAFRGAMQIFIRAASLIALRRQPVLRRRRRSRSAGAVSCIGPENEASMRHERPRAAVPKPRIFR
jgi:hypothetical protein